MMHVPVHLGVIEAVRARLALRGGKVQVLFGGSAVEGGSFADNGICDGGVVSAVYEALQGGPKYCALDTKDDFNLEAPFASLLKQLLGTPVEVLGFGGKLFAEEWV